MSRLWPFDDRQPVGLVDFIFAGVVTGTLVWPPFFGMLQCGLCIARLPRPIDPGFIIALIALLIASGAALGVVCCMVMVVGAYHRLSWMRQIGPYLAGAALIGAESWALPYLFAGAAAAWRSDAVRIAAGTALAVPAGWAATQIALRIAAVHPYRDQLGSR